MTAIDTTTLEEIADVDFETFEAAHDVGNNIAVAYYNELRNQGDQTGNQNIKNYADLAKDVASNDGLNGKFANAHTKAAGDAENVDMTVGSDAWLRMQYELMQRDLAARKDAINESGTGELDYSETDRIHTEALNEVNMPPEGFSLHVPLTHIEERSPEAAQAVFVSVLPGGGALDLAMDATKLGFGAAGNAMIDGNRSLHDLLQDFSEQAGWIETALTALEDLANILPGGLPTEAQELLDNLQALANLAENGFGFLAPWADKLKDLPLPPALVNLLPLPIKLGLIPWGQAPGQASPLILDIDGDGIELSSFDGDTTATGFDIDGDGFAEQTAWVDGDDGLLVRDLDSSGTIDSSAELFGSPTIDGFALLASFDLNGDHVINQHDAVWSDLLIWQDANEDAVTQDGELHTLAALDIVSIDLSGVTPSSSTISGNPVTHTSTYRLDGGTTRSIVDAWFVHDNTNTRHIGEYELDLRTLFLPTLRGFGNLPDLNVAMSQNEDLLLLVQEFATNWDVSRFQEIASVNDEIQDILWHWAGVENVNPASRGPYIDARNLGFLEAFFGESFLQFGLYAEPWQQGAETLNYCWEMMFSVLKGYLVFQAGASELFEGTNLYEITTGEVVGDLPLSQAGVDELEAAAPTTDIRDFWLEVGIFLHAVRGLDDLSSPEEEMLDDAIIATDPLLSWEEIRDAILTGYTGDTLDGTNGNDTLTGTIYGDVMNGYDGDDTLSGDYGDDQISGGGGEDVLYGGPGADLIDGGYENDTLHGGDGHDTMYGGWGDDALSPGSGGNVVYGGGGADEYLYGGGDDFYVEGSGSDVDFITMASGVELSDLTFFRIEDDSNGDSNLHIEIDGYGTIQTPFFVYGMYLTSVGIERIDFSNSTSFALDTLQSLTTYGTESSDYIYGVTHASVDWTDTVYALDGDDTVHSGGGADILDGGVGNDSLQAGSGDDLYLASPGFDTISDESGTDTIRLPVGYDAGDVSFIRNSSASSDLKITVNGLGQILIQGQFGYGSGAIEFLDFNGSGAVTLTDLSIETIGGAGNDNISGIGSGASEDDIIDGGYGDDTLQGGAGDDIYFFSPGADEIYETSGTDSVSFRQGILPQGISIYRDGAANFSRNLVIDDGSGNKLTVSHHFYDAAYAIESLEFFDSTVWDLTALEVETRGTAGNDQIYEVTSGDASNDDTIFGLAGNDNISGGAGNDRIDGGDGDDYVYGGFGDDTYVFGAGLDSFGEDGGNDTLLMTGGISINDVTVSDYGPYHTLIVVNSTVDEVVVQFTQMSAAYAIEWITFDDGFVTSLPDYATWISGTSGNDASAGNGGDNTIIGLAGNDTITGAGGNDDAHGGAGDDSLDGGDGADLLYGGGGDDILYGKAGLDTMHGGDGADTFVFETASAFSAIDVIRDFSVGDDDVLDLTDILDTVYDPLNDAISDFVEFTESSGSTFVSVDRDGTGGTYSMAQIIKLENVTGLASPDTLETNGNLLAA